MSLGHIRPGHKRKAINQDPNQLLKKLRFHRLGLAGGAGGWSRRQGGGHECTVVRPVPSGHPQRRPSLDPKVIRK